MQQAGVELISGITSTFGLAEAISSVRTIKNTFSKAAMALRMHRPDVLVLIDYPDFNLKLAQEARKNHIKVLYYVSPQVWAWRKKRVTKIAGWSTKWLLFCLLKKISIKNRAVVRICRSPCL